MKLRNKSWKPECVGSFNMDWRVSSSTKYVVSESLAIVNDTFHGKDVQLDGYSVILTIKHLKESDFNISYGLQLSYGASQTVQLHFVLIFTFF
jgi:hypothetical protein